MQSFWYYAYNAVGVPLMVACSSIGKLVNAKVGKAVRGRQHLFQTLQDGLSSMDGHPRFWIHVSSMGEFEQAKPVIRELKRRFREGRVIISFFSPSGYEHAVHFDEADCVCYIPLDTRKNAQRFLSAVRPDVAIMVRHDLWPNHLLQVSRENVPCVLINASVPISSRSRLAPFFRMKRFVYGYFDAIFVVSQEVKVFYEQLGLDGGRIELVGDTRYDQVMRRAEETQADVVTLKKMKRNKRCIVAGSTWPPDEDVLVEALTPVFHQIGDFWAVIVPHEPTEGHLTALEQKMDSAGLKSCRFSRLDKRRMRECDVLVVDRIGILAGLYALGDLTFVGGGFSVGIHNVLEPAALGKAVLFGPKHTNSFEAGLLKDRGVGFVVGDSREMRDRILSLFQDAGGLEQIGKKAVDLVHENRGATERIVDRIEQLIGSQ